MSLYEFLKIVHIVAAMGWVGGAILSQVHSAFVQRRANPQDLMTFIEFQATLGQKYFAPLAGIVAAAGIGMVIDSAAWGFTDTWVIIGIVLFLVSSLTGTFYLGPQTDKIKAGLAGAPDTALEKRIKNVVLATRIDLAILILVVADMVVKPGT